MLRVAITTIILSVIMLSVAIKLRMFSVAMKTTKLSVIMLRVAIKLEC